MEDRNNNGMDKYTRWERNVGENRGDKCTVGSRFTTGLRSRIFGRKSNRRKMSTI
jgi:hypothetical protein